MNWYRLAATYYLNVYDEQGKPALVGEPVKDGIVTPSLRQRLYYEFGLDKPDLKVFQTEELAQQDAMGAGNDPTSADI